MAKADPFYIIRGEVTDSVGAGAPNQTLRVKTRRHQQLST